MTALARTFAALALVMAAPAFAQPLAPSLWLDSGVAEFDLSGTGTSAVFGVRSDLALGRFAVVEAGVGYTRTAQTFSNVSYALTDIEVQAQLPLGRVRPYVGVGSGFFLVLSEDPLLFPGGRTPSGNAPDGYNAAVVTASLGARVSIAGPLLARVGGRIRGTIAGGPDVFGSTVSEATLGLGYRF